MGFWDDPSVKPEGNNYMKFDAVGDTVTGTIAKLQKRVFNAGTADERIGAGVHLHRGRRPVA